MNRFLQTILVAGCALTALNVKPVLGYSYNLNKIPEGYWTYYETNFKTQVVYFRTGNNMYGRMGNTCFSAQIYPNTIGVKWWGQVPGSLRNNYSVAVFTADNVGYQPINPQYYQQRIAYCR